MKRNERLLESIAFLFSVDYETMVKIWWSAYSFPNTSPDMTDDEYKVFVERLKQFDQWEKLKEHLTFVHKEVGRRTVEYMIEATIDEIQEHSNG